VILSAVYMLTMVQRVFWNPLVHEENRKLTDMRASELVPACVLVALMLWIGVRPNDLLDRIRPSVDALQTAVNAKRLQASAAVDRHGAPTPLPRFSR
jgi:NADH-quinone oxidoreductase subunit M